MSSESVHPTNCQESSIRHARPEAENKLVAFTDWRNHKQESPTPTSYNHQDVEQFDVLPVIDAHNHHTPTWINYQSLGGSCLLPIKTGRYNWTNCPSVNHTHFSTRLKERYSPSIAEWHGWGKKLPLEHMKDHNDGDYSGKWQVKDKTNPKYNWHRCNAITSQLELTNIQKARVQVILYSLDLDKEGRSLETMIFILTSLVCREDGRRTYPSPNGDNRDALFAAFAEEQGFSEKNIRKWLQNYGRKLDNWLRPTDQRRPLPTEPRQPQWWSLADRVA